MVKNNIEETILKILTEILSKNSNRLKLDIEMYESWGSNSLNNIANINSKNFLQKKLFDLKNLRFKEAVMVLVDKNQDKKLQKALEVCTLGNCANIISSSKRDIEIYNDRIKNSNIAIINAEKSLKNLKKVFKEEDVLKNIKQLPFIKKITIRDGCVIFRTKDLICKRINFGEYEFILNHNSFLTCYRINGEILNHDFIFISHDHSICYGGGTLEQGINTFKSQGRIDLILSATWELFRHFDDELSTPYVSWEDFKNEYNYIKQRKRDGRDGEW